MAELGKVIEKKGRYLVLKMQRHSACGSCGACRLGDDNESLILEVINNCKADVSDYVEVSIKREKFLQAVMIMYIGPLIGLLLGILLGYLIGKNCFPNKIEDLSIVLGLLFTLISFVLIRVSEKKFKRDSFRPVAIRVVEKG